MRILVLSYYYPPDLSAGSFRTGALTAELSIRSGVSKIDVLTTQPSRYDEARFLASKYDTGNKIEIIRFETFSHGGSMMLQIISFIKFAWNVFDAVKRKKYDLVFATSSRLGTAVLGALIAKHTNAKLYLDIRDIFSDTLSHVLSKFSRAGILPIVYFFERYVILSASHVNFVSAGFKKYFFSKYPLLSCSYFTNGVDSEFIDFQSTNTPLPNDYQISGVIKILYAGNIGEGQGLHKILPNLASRLGSKYTIEIIGSGGMISALMAATVNCKNINILPPCQRNLLLKKYKEADILFLHLNNYSAFEKVLPSKIFEYAATGKPILAGVSGFSKEFIEEEVENAKVFNPCDVNQALIALAELKLKTVERKNFIQKYSRLTIVREMVDSIMMVGLQ